MVQVLAESRHHEEVCLEPLSVAVRLPLQQFEGIPLVISLDYDLIDHSQNSDFEAGPWDCWRGRACSSSSWDCDGRWTESTDMSSREADDAREL